ncbi:MAG: hypothetical protein ACREJP_03060, partial [Candidatus Methylomirabilales bacterium]
MGRLRRASVVRSLLPGRGAGDPGLALAGVALLVVGALLVAGPAIAASLSFSPTPGSPYSVGNAPAGLIVRNFKAEPNAAPRPDIAVANFDSDTITILLRDETGEGFTAGAPIPVGDGPSALAVENFNGDSSNNLDIAVANSLSDNVTLLLGDGLGNFTQFGDPIPVGDDPRAIVHGSFDLSTTNASPDLAVANFGSNNITILLGNGPFGDGTFSPGPNSPIQVGTGPSAMIQPFSFNTLTDGTEDIAVANFGSDNVTMLLGDGMGRFTQALGSPISVGDGPSGIDWAQFDAGASLDLAVSNSLSNDVTVLLGDALGTFTQASGSPIPVGAGPSSIATGFIQAEENQGAFVFYLAVANRGSSDVSLLRSKGDGTFCHAQGSPVALGTGAAPASIRTGDNNDVIVDIKFDLVTANSGTNNVSVFKNTTIVTANDPVTCGTPPPPTSSSTSSTSSTSTSSTSSSSTSSTSSSSTSSTSSSSTSSTSSSSTSSTSST